MPDKRRHRGAHPQDATLFAPPMWPALRSAVVELSWLLGHDYATPSALKLVGDRHNLTERQRTAVMRCACSDTAMKTRLVRQVDPRSIGGRQVWIDGYNVLTTVETALAGGVVLIARDSCFRDIASMHGTYRKVEETSAALELVGRSLASRDITSVTWLLDKPVSNSGRLASIIRELAGARGWKWEVEIVFNPDAVLSESPHVVATADSGILDRSVNWLSLARLVVCEHVPDAKIVDVSGHSM
jgi:hypothetical protein